MRLSDIYQEARARVEESLNYHFSDEPLVVTAENNYDSSYDNPASTGTDLENPRLEEVMGEDEKLDPAILE
ncbi:MAG: hypothetical protein ABEJ83_02290 [Candidatus Nanohaloarchaea archaeon]